MQVFWLPCAYRPQSEVLAAAQLPLWRECRGRLRRSGSEVAAGWPGGRLCSRVPVALCQGSRNPVSLLCSAGGGGRYCTLCDQSGFFICFALLLSTCGQSMLSKNLCSAMSCSLGRQADTRASPRSAESALVLLTAP